MGNNQEKAKGANALSESFNKHQDQEEVSDMFCKMDMAVEPLDRINSDFAHISGAIYYGTFFNGTTDVTGFYQIENEQVLSQGWKVGSIKGIEKIKILDNTTKISGNISWPDGSYFSGNVENGLISGKALFKFEDGTEVNGTFEEGFLSGYATVTKSDGSSYKGQYKQGKKYGKGVRKSRGKLEYYGQFQDNKREGYGVLWFMNQTCVFEGAFSHNKPRVGVLSTKSEGMLFGEFQETPDHQRPQGKYLFKNMQFKSMGKVEKTDQDMLDDLKRQRSKLGIIPFGVKEFMDQSARQNGIM